MSPAGSLSPILDLFSLALLGLIALMLLWRWRRQEPQEQAPAASVDSVLSNDPASVLASERGYYLGPGQGALAMALLEPPAIAAPMMSVAPADLLALADPLPLPTDADGDDPTAAPMLSLWESDDFVPAWTPGHNNPAAAAIYLFLVVLTLIPLLLRLL